MSVLAVITFMVCAHACLRPSQRRLNHYLDFNRTIVFGSGVIIGMNAGTTHHPLVFVAAASFAIGLVPNQFEHSLAHIYATRWESGILGAIEHFENEIKWLAANKPTAELLERYI